MEPATLEDKTTMSSPDIGNQIHNDAASHPRTTENSNTALPKPKISQHIIHLSINFHMASSNILLVFDYEVLYALINNLKAKLSRICHLLALLGAHHILHASRIRVNYETQPKFKNVLCSFFHLCSTNLLRDKLVSTVC